MLNKIKLKKKNLVVIKKKLKKLLSITSNFNKYSDLFFKKIFCKFIYEGKKYKAVYLYLQLLNHIKKIFFKKYLKFYIYNKNTNIKQKKKKHLNTINVNLFTSIYLFNINMKICPKIDFSYVYKKREKNIIPNLKKSNYSNKNKTFSLASSWLKKSISKRKEKTFKLRVFSELFDIRKNRGGTIIQKLEFYKNLYNNKKYYKYKNWI